MLEQQPDDVEFFETGQQVPGRYHCSECNYGIVVQLELPLCPMCGGTSWEELADSSAPLQ